MLHNLVSIGRVTNVPFLSHWHFLASLVTDFIVWTRVFYWKIHLHILLDIFIRNYIGNWVAYFQYPHEWRYQWFHWYQVCLLNCTFRSSSKVSNLQKSSECSKNVWEHLSGLPNNFGNLKSLESGWKSSENHQKCSHQYIYIIKRTLHISLKIWILCSRGKNNIPWVQSTANEWDIVLATRTLNSYIATV